LVLEAAKAISAKSVDFVEALPYLPTGELDRLTLKNQYGKGRDKMVD